jgi:hypothetical protein
MWKVEGRMFGIPKINSLLQLLVYPYRGLFVSSPILLLGIPGAMLLFRNKTWRAEAVTCTTVSLFFIIFIASFHAWHGGSAPGPRYLLPAYPFMYLLAAFLVSRAPYLFAAAGSASIIINLAITIVAIEIPREIHNPLITVVLKNIMAGRVSVNPVPFSHIAAYPNIYDLADIKQWQNILNMNSFNLGEIFFPYSLMSVIPLLCFWLLWGFCWAKSSAGSGAKN